VGWRQNPARLGEHLLRNVSRLHDGRSFDRAREGLIERGLLHYQPGKRGRGHRSLYELILDPAEKPADERALASEKPAEKPGEKPAGKPAPERGRIEERVESRGVSCLSPDTRSGARSGNGQLPLDGDALTALQELVAKLADADPGTLRTFAQAFSDLSADDFDRASDALDSARKRNVIEKGETPFVHGVLYNIGSGYA
jgi:hypothetical protein